MRTHKITAVVALFLIQIDPSSAVQTHNRIMTQAAIRSAQKASAHNRQSDDSNTSEDLNPDFESPMTLVEWKNFSADETLEMYQKADYNQ